MDQHTFLPSNSELPFNPLLDNYGDASWTDLEADSESDLEDSPPRQPEASANPSPRLGAQIIELAFEDSEGEEDRIDLLDADLKEEGNDTEALNLNEVESIVSSPANAKDEIERLRKKNNIVQTHVGTERNTYENAPHAAGRDSPEASDHLELLSGFMVPTKDRLRSETTEASQRALHITDDIVSKDTFGVDEWEEGPRRESMSARCEFCQISHRSCDGVRPICGYCQSSRKKTCKWPQGSLTRRQHSDFGTDYQTSARTPLNLTTLVSPVLNEVPTTLADSRRGNPPSTDDRERTRSWQDLVARVMAQDGGQTHTKDLVFSDVLVGANDEEDTAEQQAGRPGCKVQYLDLSESDSVVVSPQRPTVKLTISNLPKLGKSYHPTPEDRSIMNLKLQGLSCGEVKKRLKTSESEHNIRNRWNALKRGGFVAEEARNMKPIPYACRPCVQANQRGSCNGMVPCEDVCKSRSEEQVLLRGR